MVLPAKFALMLLSSGVLFLGFTEGTHQCASPGFVLHGLGTHCGPLEGCWRLREVRDYDQVSF